MSAELHLDGGVHWRGLEHAGGEAVGEELSGHVRGRLAWGYEGRRHPACDEGRPVEAIEPRVLEQRRQAERTAAEASRLARL